MTRQLICTRLLALGLAFAAPLLSGCAANLPSEEFERFNIAMGGLNEIAREADPETEGFALDALVAKSRQATRLRAEDLKSSKRWKDLWELVDSRHSTLEFLESYTDLLYGWAELARERIFWSGVRVVWDGDTEEKRLKALEDRLRFRTETLKDRLVSEEPPKDGLDSEEAPNEDGRVLNSTIAIFDTVQEMIDKVQQGRGRRADSERLGRLMRKTQADLALITSYGEGIEEKIVEKIDTMVGIILKSANAARPPGYLPERLKFDESAILRIARANRLSRVSELIQEALKVVPSAHEELEKARAGLPEDGGLPSLQKLHAEVEQGPERIRGEVRIPEPQAPIFQMPEQENVHKKMQMQRRGDESLNY